jgi:prepilin-type processing-associated H-X9-DG protein
VLAILVLLALMVMLALPRQRENARLAGCRANLMQIGTAIALYDRAQGALPRVPTPSADGDARPGPLEAMMATLGVSDLTDLTDAPTAPPHGSALEPSARFIPGFVCLSDPAASRIGAGQAPTSYRATAGDDPQGTNGGFAPGQRLRLADVESGDGLSFTGAFSERMLGTGTDNVASPVNYLLIPGHLSSEGCPAPAGASWRGDAGSSWAESSWRSTLYNHAMKPGASPSCIEAGGAAAFMGTSSGHSGGVNVLLFDGAVRTVSPTVDLRIWKALGTIRESATKANTPPDSRPKQPDDKRTPQ